MKNFDFDNSLINETQNRMWGKSEYRSLLMIFVAIYLFIAVIMTSYIILPVNVVGESMLPTLEDEDKVILFKRGEIGYGDIIVLYAPNLFNYQQNKMGEDIIKRVMGLPGDTVWFQLHSDGKHYFHRQREYKGNIVETVLLHENYINDANSSKSSSTLFPDKKVVLSEGEYYVLGDNRPVSQDSRYDSVGVIKKEYIKGKVLLIIREGNVKFFEKVSA